MFPVMPFFVPPRVGVRTANAQLTGLKTESQHRHHHRRADENAKETHRRSSCPLYSTQNLLFDRRSQALSRTAAYSSRTLPEASTTSRFARICTTRNK